MILRLQYFVLLKVFLGTCMWTGVLDLDKLSWLKSACLTALLTFANAHGF